MRSIKPMGPNIIKIPIGDWSNDGHGRYKTFRVESNMPVSVLQDAYKASCKLTGLQFNNGEDFTGGLTDGYNSERLICTEYQQYSLSDFAIKTLREFNCPERLLEDEGYMESQKLAELIMWFISLSVNDPWLKFDYTFKEEEAEYLNGFWNANLNHHFGYGLFD